MRACRNMILALAVALLAASSANAQETHPRPTITIVPFDTARTGWAPPPNFGATLSELLGDRLIDSGKFRVMDYTWLFDTDDPRARPPLDLIAKRAADAGVDYVVMGSISRYSNEQHHRRGGVAGFVPFIGGGGRTTAETVVALTIRVIDARNGEVVATATPEGSASRRNVSLGGLAFGLAGRSASALNAGGALFSSSNSGSREAVNGEAVQDAIDLAADALVNAAARLIKS